MPDRLSNFETQPYPVVFAGPARDGFVAEEPSDFLPPGLYWSDLRRVAGTPTDGTWCGSLAVSSVSTGRVVPYLVVVGPPRRGSTNPGTTYNQLGERLETMTR